MVQVNPIKSLSSNGISVPAQMREANFDKQLAVMQADALLKSTRQYPTWRDIRENDPGKAFQVAQIILERHTFIEGSVRRDAAGRRHFDQLTEHLRAVGIYLYKSHQFKQPIFDLNESTTVSKHSADSQPQAPSDSVKNAMLQNLRNRFKNRDCLEFVANLLEDNGIAYYGKQGLANRLIGQARTQGKKLNAYLTGEGLTRELSNQPVSLTLKRGHVRSFDNVWQQIRPHIKAGSILSFSSKSFGHTGLVDQIDDQWVYFNSSGKIGKPETYQIKAENLELEIKSWFQRAKRQDTFLNITIGSIDSNLAVQFQNATSAPRPALEQSIDLLASHRIGSQSSAV